MPDPEEMILQLPTGLQSFYKQTLEVEHRSAKAQIKAELKLMSSIRGTLEATKHYLTRATEAEKAEIAKVLWFFETQDEDPHGNPPGGPGMGMGQGGPPGPEMADEMVRRMIEQTEHDVERLRQELAEMSQ